MNKKYDEALKLSGSAIKRLPYSSILTIRWLQIRVNTRQANIHHLAQTADVLTKQPFDVQMIAWLRQLVGGVVAVLQLSEYYQLLLDLIDELSIRVPYKNFPLFKRFVSYNKARLFLAMLNIEKAQQYYELAIRQYGRISSAMEMVSELAEAGQFDAAMKLLSTVKQGVKSGKLDPSPHTREYYENEIKIFKSTLRQDILAKSHANQ